jgi:hypothetical protein
LADVPLAFGAAGKDHLAMAVITNRDEFEIWLADKPTSWAQSLACRVALKVLPTALLSSVRRGRADRALVTFRALGISWAARNMSDQNMRVALAAATDAVTAATDYPEGSTAGSASASASYTAIAAAISAAGYAAHIAADDVASAEAASADDASAIWSSVRDDAVWLEGQSERGPAGEALVAQPLWLDMPPAWFATNWAQARTALQAMDASYALWIRWFERRIEGRTAAFDLPPAADREVQIRIAQQEQLFWNRDPGEINSDIQSWIDAATPPDIPAQHPSEIQTLERDGRVARAQIPPAATEPDQDARRQAAWREIRNALDDYLADGPAANWPRLNRMIDRLAAALGEEFATLNPVGLGVQAQYLQAYAERADEFLIADRAADLVGLNVGVCSFLAQLKEWQAYLADSEVNADVTAEALEAATAVVTAIEQSDAAETEVKIVLAEMQADAQDEARATDPDLPRLPAYRQRFLGGLGNVLATAGKIALDFTKARLTAVGKGVDKGLEKVGERATLALFASVAVYLSTLAGALPELAWLAPLLAFLRNNVLKD